MDSVRAATIKAQLLVDVLGSLAPFGDGERIEDPDQADRWAVARGVQAGIALLREGSSREGALHLVAFAPNVEAGELLDRSGKPVSVLDGGDGLVLLRLPLDDEVLGGRLLLGPRVLELAPELFAAAEHPPLPVDVEVSLEAYSLDNYLLAAEGLERWASRASGLRAHVAKRAAEAIRNLRVAQSAARDAVGKTWALFTWRGDAARARVFVEATDESQQVPAALEAANALGWSLARQHRGFSLDGGPTALPFVTGTAPSQHADAVEASGLAVALASYSRELDLAIPKNLHSRGSIDADGRVEALPLERVRLLLTASARERPGSEILVAPAVAAALPGLSPDVVVTGVRDLEDAVRHVFGGRAGPAKGPDLSLGEADLDTSSPGHALEKARAIASSPLTTGLSLLRARRLEGACLVQLGRPLEAATALDEAFRVLCEDELPNVSREDVALLLLARAGQLLDMFDFPEAIGALEKARAVPCDPVLRPKIDGLHGHVLRHAGRDEEAVPLLVRALATTELADRVSFGCDLALAFAAAGKRRRAARVLEEVAADVRSLSGAALVLGMGSLARARALLAFEEKAPETALRAAEDGLSFMKSDPGASPLVFSALKRLEGRAYLALGARSEGLQALLGTREIPRPRGFLDLVVGLGEIEASMVLLGEPREPGKGRVLERVVDLVTGYAPALERFEDEIESLSAPGPAAREAIRLILDRLRY